MRRNRGIHRPHAKHEPSPFTEPAVWHSVAALTMGTQTSPVTAQEVAQHVRTLHPRTTSGPVVTHNDLINVRRHLEQLVKAGHAEHGCERPNSTGQRPRQYRCLTLPPVSA